MYILGLIIKFFCWFFGRWKSDFMNFLKIILQIYFFQILIHYEISCRRLKLLPWTIWSDLLGFWCAFSLASPFSQIEMQEKFAWAAYHGSAFSELTSWLLKLLCGLSTKYNMALAKDKNNLSSDEASDDRGKIYKN